MVTVSGNPFPPEALEANRSGRLTEAQLAQLRAQARGTRRGELWGAAALLAIGAFVIYSSAQGRADLTITLIGIGCLAVAVVLLMRSVIGTDALTRDVRSPRVQMVEGAILRQSHQLSSSSGSGSSSYYTITVAGERCKVDRATYEAAPEMGYVRLYFLPRSHHVVNLERLPDRPLPEGATPMGLFGGMVKAWLRADTTAEAEAAATMATMATKVRDEMEGPAVPPPLVDRDPRPLDEAILGTWRNTLMTFTFTTDGTVAATIAGTHQRTGRWSVEPDGKLRVDLMGHEAATEAWVAADRLTLSLQGKAMTLTRMPAEQ
jgi:hypothetical protein